MNLTLASVRNVVLGQIARVVAKAEVKVEVKEDVKVDEAVALVLNAT